MHRNRAELCTVVELQASVGDATKAVRLLQDRVKYWREIAGRRIDDLQYLGGRGLSLKRLPRLGQEARILDGDHRLVGEILDKLDLSLGEWSHLLAVDDDRPNQRALLEHWNGEKGSRSCLLDG